MFYNFLIAFFLLEANIAETMWDEDMSEEEFKKAMLGCCKKKLGEYKDASCEMAMSGNTKDSGLSQSQSADLIFDCVSSSDKMAEDHTECCRKADVPEECLEFCKPDGYEDNSDRLKKMGANLKCSAATVVPAFTGHGCEPHPKGKIIHKLFKILGG